MKTYHTFRSQVKPEVSVRSFKFLIKCNMRSIQTVTHRENRKSYSFQRVSNFMIHIFYGNLATRFAHFACKALFSELEQ